MKRIVVPLAMLISGACHAAENSNPFVQPQLASSSAGAALPQASLPLPEDPLPQSFTENRSVFDMLEVVGRKAPFAVLRYPMSGSPTAATSGTQNVGTANSSAATLQGVSYRSLTVRDGRNTFIGGRSFKVVLPRGGSNVLLVDSKNGKVLWEGDMSGPKTYYANPNAPDFQYTPPASAGSGVGRSTGGTSPAYSAIGQSGAPMPGMQSTGIMR